MKEFDILEIGEELDETAGLLDGCELCGHCRFLRESVCGRLRSQPPTPLDAFIELERVGDARLPATRE